MCEYVEFLVNLSDVIFVREMAPEIFVAYHKHAAGFHSNLLFFSFNINIFFRRLDRSRAGCELS